MFRLAALLALLLAPAAVAQQPPDERVAAGALAAATERFSEAIEDTEAQQERAAAFRCKSVERRIPRNRRKDAISILIRNTNRVIAGFVREDLGRLRTDLANAQTRDPALLSGRAAWRQLARAFMALPPGGDACAEIRAWLRAGAPRSEGREAQAEVTAVLSLAGREFERKVRGATRRMIQLGVPRAQAETFSDS